METFCLWSVHLQTDFEAITSEAITSSVFNRFSKNLMSPLDVDRILSWLYLTHFASYSLQSGQHCIFFCAATLTIMKLFKISYSEADHILSRSDHCCRITAHNQIHVNELCGHDPLGHTRISFSQAKSAEVLYHIFRLSWFHVPSITLKIFSWNLVQIQSIIRWSAENKYYNSTYIFYGIMPLCKL